MRLLTRHQTAEVVKFVVPFAGLFLLAGLMVLQLAVPGLVPVRPRTLVDAVFAHVLYFPVLFLVPAAVGWYVGSRWQRDWWLEMGRGVGLSPLEEPGRLPYCPPLVGTVDGRDVWLIPRRWGGESNWSYTEIEVAVEGSVPTTLRVFERALFAPSATAETGDAAFDDRFAVRADDPDRVGEVLDSTARRALLDRETFGMLQVVDGFGTLEAEGSAVRFSHPGRFYDSEVVEGQLEAVVAVARAIERSDDR